jgi:hypothetical protein
MLQSCHVMQTEVERVGKGSSEFRNAELKSAPGRPLSATFPNYANAARQREHDDAVVFLYLFNSFR